LSKLKKPEQVYGLHFTRGEIEEAVKNNRLLTLDIETSHVCNYQCIYCYASSGKQLSNELSFEQLKDIVLQAKELGVKNISIIGGGEPMLYKNILDLARFIHQQGISQDIFTNGSVMTREIAAELLEMQVQIVVKLNSRNQEVQDNLAGVKGAGEKILRTLDLLIEMGYNKNNLLGVESIICKQNIDEIPEMWVWARERNIIPYFEMITFQGRAKLHNLNVSVERLEKLFKALLKIDEERFGFTWNPHPPIAGLSCNRHFYNLVVTSNGYVTPCVGVEIRLGNVRYQKLADIIKNNVLIKNFRDMNKNVHGSCRTCRLNADCYGCRGMAYHLTGDCFASDPLCWNNENRISIKEDGTI
jgi:radical SAM protein with 4Fe4S-binding SPASM domain